MSYFVCSNCGARHEVFGHGGARNEALRLGVPFLGEIPLDAELRERSDRGEPVVAANPKSSHASAFIAIARKVWSAVETGGLGRPAPKFTFET
jgi:ATP-binding protein involved in chromosome partitioning